MRDSRKPELLPNAHPGEVLLLDFLKPIRRSPGALAKAVGVSVRRINDILHGRRAITADMSARLARYFGVSEEFFLDMQRAYDRRTAERGANRDWTKVEAYIRETMDYERIVALMEDDPGQRPMRLSGAPARRRRRSLRKGQRHKRKRVRARNR